jgi:hypothetical protein
MRQAKDAAGAKDVMVHGTDPIELELTSVIEGPGVTHLRYRIRS